MSHAMDREEFDEVIDAISQIQGKTIKLERALRLLKSKNPDSRLGYLYYEAFGDEPVSREESIERMKKRIELLGERKEQIIRHLETAFSDKNHIWASLFSFLCSQQRSPSLRGITQTKGLCCVLRKLPMVLHTEF